MVSLVHESEYFNYELDISRVPVLYNPTFKNLESKYINNVRSTTANLWCVFRNPSYTFARKTSAVKTGRQPLIVYTSGCDKVMVEIYWKSASQWVYFGMEQEIQI